MEQKRESMNKNRIRGASAGRAGLLLRSPQLIKGAERKFGDCARKASELTSGDLSGVAQATERPERELTAGQKSAEGIVGFAVGEASEALRSRKAEKQIGQAGNEERRSKRERSGK